MIQAAEDDLEFAQDGSSLPPSGELKLDSNDSDYDADSRDDSYFENEVNNVNLYTYKFKKLKTVPNLNKLIGFCRLKQPS